MELVKPLKELWSTSLATGTVLQTLKTGIIIPIHRGGNKGLPKQYWPVVLTSHIIKICERVIREQMANFFETNNLFNEEQHNFRQIPSWLSQLQIHYEEILRNIQEGENADIIYLDFAKTFDKVDHSILMHNLWHHGIYEPLGKCLHSLFYQSEQRGSLCMESYQRWVKSRVECSKV